MTACNSNRSASFSVDSMACPSPLVTPDDPTRDPSLNINGGSCALPCQSIEWTSDQWSIAEGLVNSLAITSFILMSSCVVTWMTFASRRKQRALLFFMWSIWLRCLGTLIGVVRTNGHDRDLGCVTNTDLATQIAGGWTTLSAVLSLLGTHCSTGWYLVLAINLFTQVIVQAKPTAAQAQRMNVFHHLHASGLSVILVICTLAMGDEGRSSVQPLAWFVDKTYYWLVIFTLFLLRILIRSAIGVVLLCLLRGIGATAASNASQYFPGDARKSVPLPRNLRLVGHLPECHTRY